jgi:predicted membrane-bound dolichyl-phosphate-mannose-protein mannosyltransferase
VGRGYVTDEVWYVSSSRVILKKILGLNVKQDPGNYGATIVFQSSSQAQTACYNIASRYSLKTRCDYSKIPAIHVTGYVDEVWGFINEVNKSLTIVDIIPGWQFPDNEGINNYINWEHPPLGKYLIALSMITLGDYPLYWRIPIISFGVLASILVYLILYRLTRSYIPSLIGALLFSIDNMTRAIYSIALLDGFVATLTLLSLYYALSGKYRYALLAGIIAGLFKASGLFTSYTSSYNTSQRDCDEDTWWARRLHILYNTLWCALNWIMDFNTHNCLNANSKLHGGFRVV